MAKKKSAPQLSPPGSLAQQGHGHDGTEQAYTRLLVSQLRGEKGLASGLVATGGTFNHIGLYRVSGYAWSASEGRPALVDFLRTQVDPTHKAFAGHMAYGGRNEINTSSHAAWNLLWAGATWLLALRRQDAELLALVRLWWRHELALQGLGAGPRGDVELPDSRDFQYPADTADQRKQRNICRAILLGQPARVPAMAGTVESGPKSTDMACIWALLVLRKEFPQEFAEQIHGIDDNDLPVLKDPMQAIFTDQESVVWFDTMTDAADCCWWVNRRRDGSVHYGIIPGAQRSPGGPRPASVPEPPAVEGQEARRVRTPGRPG